jgi:hypothetical protein
VAKIVGIDRASYPTEKRWLAKWAALIRRWFSVASVQMDTHLGKIFLTAYFCQQQWRAGVPKHLAREAAIGGHEEWKSAPETSLQYCRW